MERNKRRRRTIEKTGGSRGTGRRYGRRIGEGEHVSPSQRMKSVDEERGLELVAQRQSKKTDCCVEVEVAAGSSLLLADKAPSNCDIALQSSPQALLLGCPSKNVSALFSRRFNLDSAFVSPQEESMDKFDDTVSEISLSSDEPENYFDQEE